MSSDSDPRYAELEERAMRRVAEGLAKRSPVGFDEMHVRVRRLVRRRQSDFRFSFDDALCHAVTQIDIECEVAAMLNINRLLS